ncbi:hypothetical protein D1B31_06490 [Neobacillus notoginsengisoli]|uniref:Uncharacterized protein n=1 Tax=Neobacillus notoginsengisoli TaxID=1578198 RepID=A0A417YY31_9BACI|nr:hypothetical protein [Neobacillus notoginsengisoli]RHW42265.1 hypothetical protein D1B31_06490 [Neobacillus notoginsengisoli]
MFMKVCTECRKPSFSSCDTGTWLCSVCGEDISSVKLQAPESRPKHVELMAVKFGEQPIEIDHRQEYACHFE